MSPNPEIALFSTLAIGYGLGVWVLGALTVFLTAERTKHSLASSLLFIGGVLVGVGAIASYGQAGLSFNLLPWCYFGTVPLAIRLDTMTCFFLVVVAFVICPIAIFAPAYLKSYKDRLHPGIYWHCIFMFMLALVLTFMATNAICFLIFWETMSLTAIALIASDHIRQKARHAALIYMGVTTISTVLILGSFLWYYKHFHSWYFSDWHAAGALTVPALLLFFGLAVKVGIWPFHIWMSYAQAEAPTPVAVFMSTVMKVAGIYALIRLLVLDNDNGLILAYISIALGSISIVWGSLFALLERDLKRLLSYSSVENIGLVLVALGICLMARHYQQLNLAYLALVAALFHTVNHSLSKAGLFVGAGTVEAVVHTRDLAFLGGLAKRMPWTAGCFLANSLAITALPPFSGFASKWMVYQSLFKLAMSNASVVDRLFALILVGVLSLVGALSLASYTKAIGICFLGRARSEMINQTTELSNTSVLVQLFFAIGSLIIGLAVTSVVQLLWPVCSEILPSVSLSNNIFPVPLRTIAILTGSATCILIYLLIILAKRSTLGLRTYITWECGYGNLPARAEETGTSFSESIARIFAPILRYRIATQIKGKDRRHFPEVIKFESVTAPLLEGLIFKPLMKMILILNRSIAKLQTGSIHLYLLYVFLTLIILVGIGTRL